LRSLNDNNHQVHLYVILHFPLIFYSLSVFRAKVVIQVHHLMLLFSMIHLLNKIPQRVVLVNDHILKVIPMHQKKQMIFRKNPSNLSFDHNLFTCMSFFHRLVDDGYREGNKSANQSTSEDDSFGTNKSNEQEPGHS
jgi:hypothetical protein